MDWLKFLIEAPFRAIGELLLVIERCRGRVAGFLNRPKIKLLTQAVIMATALAWLAVWLLADGEQGRRLDDTIQKMWGTTGSGRSDTPAP